MQLLIVGSGHVPPLKQVDEHTAGKDETQNEDKMKMSTSILTTSSIFAKLYEGSKLQILSFCTK